MSAYHDGTLDLVSALERMGGDEELLAEVIALFMEDFPVLLASIESAVAARDGGRLTYAAHALKGAAATLSAVGVVRAAQVLEIIGRDGRVDAMDEAWTDLQAEAARLVEHFRSR